MFIFPPLPTESLFSLSSLISFSLLTHFFLSLYPASSTVPPHAHLHTTPSLPRFSLSLPLFSSSSPVRLLSSAFSIFILSSLLSSVFPPFFIFILSFALSLSFVSFYLSRRFRWRQRRVKCGAEWRKKRKGGGATRVSAVAQVSGSQPFFPFFFMPAVVVSGGVRVSSRGEEGGERGPGGDQAKSRKTRGEEGKGEEERNRARWRPGGLRLEGGRKEREEGDGGERRGVRQLLAQNGVGVLGLGFGLGQLWAWWILLREGVELSQVSVPFNNPATFNDNHIPKPWNQNQIEGLEPRLGGEQNCTGTEANNSWWRPGVVNREEEGGE